MCCEALSVMSFLLHSPLQLIDAEQKSIDLGNDVGILSKMMNGREGSLSITRNDLG